MIRTKNLASQPHSQPMNSNTAQLSMKDRPEAEGDDARARLRQRFARLGISAPVPYPAHATVDEGKRLRGDMAGTFTKNLLLKDKKGRLFLLAIHEDRDLDLKTLHTLLGAQGRLGFASGDRMIEILGVAPGALTPLGVINDRDGLVTVAIDAALLDAKQLMPGAYAGSVCGRSLSANPVSTLGFEKRHNKAFRIDDEVEFIKFMMAEIPPAPPGAAELRAANSARVPA
jgi:Ala-tRNA(Pro) deacylase